LVVSSASISPPSEARVGSISFSTGDPTTHIRA
jgi:hypothetical protein